jgi:hypothetical protein
MNNKTIKKNYVGKFDTMALWLLPPDIRRYQAWGGSQTAPVALKCEHALELPEELVKHTLWIWGL